MYVLFHLKNCFKCMCLHLEFECFALKLEVTTSYAWSRPLSLWWWHVLLSVTCDHTSSAVHSWLGVFTVILYPRKYSLVTSGLGGDSVTTASILVLLNTSWIWATDFHVSYIHKYERGIAVSLLCSVLFMSVPLPYLTEMSCREMLYSAIDP